MDENPSEPLSGGWQTEVRLVDGEIRRAANPWSRSTISLLRHLHATGFSAAPAPINSGFDEDGCERLTFVPGASPQPSPWSIEGLHLLGGLLRQLHDSCVSFEPDAEAVWKPWFGRALGNPSKGFGHGDLGPWNIMARDGIPTGFIDWDTAGPLDPLWEVAQAGWLNAQLHDDDVAERAGLGDANERGQQLAVFLDGYRLRATDRINLVDKMVEIAARSAAAEAIEHRVVPETTAGVTTVGYPIAWAMAWRIRSARWMLEHRSILERAIAT